MFLPVSFCAAFENMCALIPCPRGITHFESAWRNDQFIFLLCFPRVGDHRQGFYHRFDFFYCCFSYFIRYGYYQRDGHTTKMNMRGRKQLFIGNDTEHDRNRLVILLSEDEGRTWTRRRYLENDPPGPLAGRYHYPSVIQAKDGSLHATYSHHLSTSRDLPKDRDGLPAHSSIKHAHFNLAWVLAGDALPGGAYP